MRRITTGNDVDVVTNDRVSGRHRGQLKVSAIVKYTILVDNLEGGETVKAGYGGAGGGVTGGDGKYTAKERCARQTPAVAHSKQLLERSANGV